MFHIQPKKSEVTYAEQKKDLKTNLTPKLTNITSKEDDKHVFIVTRMKNGGGGKNQINVHQQHDRNHLEENFRGIQLDKTWKLFQTSITPDTA